MANLPVDNQRYYANPVHAIPTWGEEGNVHMIVEVNKGTITKYEIVTELGLLKLDRVGYSYLAYPFTYGEIPKTLDKDNDPLDIFLPFVTEPLIPGCLVEVRIIGVMEMIDGGEQDDKIIGMVASDKRFDHIEKIEDLSPHFIKETKYFWEHYKDLKKPGTVQVGEFLGKDAAVEIINKAVARYNNMLLPMVK